MNWIAIGLAAAAGAVAAVIASLVVRKPKEKGVLYAFVFVVLFAVLNALGKEFLLPTLSLPFELAKAEQALLAIPAYQAIKLHDPAVYDAVVADLRSGLKRGLSEDELIGQIKPRIEQIIVQRIPKASDSAVVGYMTVMVREIRELNRQNPELCYKFLFPQQYGAINLQKHVPKELLEADLSALALVIETSAKSPQSLPTEAEVATDLELAVAALIEAHGEAAVAVLQDLHNPAVSKAKGCSVTADLYDRVLALPLERSSKVLRFMLSQAR
jgi:hypothetical protein